MALNPSKLYYRIGEVCRILKVEAHVLRYWETEFPMLAPKKNKAGQRTYRPKDIELLLSIRRLLYDEGFTIAGARRQLSRRSGPEPEAAAPLEPVPDSSAKPPAKGLDQVREELENILTLLERG